MLTIVGGCYREVCLRPDWNQLFGSGVRAAAAVAKLLPTPPRLVTRAADRERRSLAFLAGTYDFALDTHPRPAPVEFQYDHPLTPPRLYPDRRDIGPVPSFEVEADCVLAFSFIEGDCRVAAGRLVYDPQAGRRAVPPSQAGLRSSHLAIVANLGEARAMTLALGGSLAGDGHPATEFGRFLLAREGAEVVVVKNGVEGATVVTAERTQLVPSFITPTVFPIGSGDVFSAVFASLWGAKNVDPFDAARLASAATAHYCHTRTLPLPPDLTPLADVYEAGDAGARGAADRPLVYLAGPFWTLPQVWLLNESRRCLEGQDLGVFSPLHEVGLLSDNPTAEQVAAVARADLSGLERAAAVFALLDGLDPGTLFEVGYARSRGIPVVGFAEAVPRSALTMYEGTGCFLTPDFATAVYRAGWEARRR